MAKKKVDTVTINNLNGSRLPSPLKFDIYYDGFFFCYLPPEIEGIIRREYLEYKKDRDKISKKDIFINVIRGESPQKINNILYQSYSDKYSSELKEKKIIAFRFKFNSEHTYFNHSSNIPFADTPALSIWWKIFYHIKLPDGSEKIFSHPYKGFGNICSNKFATNVEEYKEKYIDWTEEREYFFKEITKSMEGMISKINNFFTKDSSEIALLVDNKAGLLTY